MIITIYDYTGRAKEIQIPAASAEVRHGKWMTKEYVYDDVNGDYWEERPAESYDDAYCSLCGEYAGLDGVENSDLTPYCPHCGAKMGGESDANT